MLPVWELQISLFAGDDVTAGLEVVWDLVDQCPAGQRRERGS